MLNIPNLKTCNLLVLKKTQKDNSNISNEKVAYQKMSRAKKIDST